MTNAANEKQVDNAKQREKRIAEQKAEDLKKLLALPEFRRYLWCLIADRCCLLQSPGSNNGSIQSSNIGRQDVARELWAEVESVDSRLIPQMMSEALESFK